MIKIDKVPLLDFPRWVHDLIRRISDAVEASGQILSYSFDYEVRPSAFPPGDRHRIGLEIRRSCGGSVQINQEALRSCLDTVRAASSLANDDLEQTVVVGEKRLASRMLQVELVVTSFPFADPCAEDDELEFRDQVVVEAEIKRAVDPSCEDQA